MLRERREQMKATQNYEDGIKTEEIGYSLAANVSLWHVGCFENRGCVPLR